jgi:aryl-alcohol dehydrogenase-like predicted oxidoreductase
VAERPEITVATKMGRRLVQPVANHSPGARDPEQARANAAAAALPALDDAAMEHVAGVYERRIAPRVHQRW